MKFSDALLEIAKDENKYITCEGWDGLFMCFLDGVLTNEDTTPVENLPEFLTSEEEVYTVETFNTQAENSFEKFKKAVENNKIFDYIDWAAVERECLS